MDRRLDREAEHLGSLRQPSVQSSHLQKEEIVSSSQDSSKELNDMVNMAGPARKNPVSLQLRRIKPLRGKHSLF